MNNLQLCKDWFSHCDERDSMNTNFDIEKVNGLITSWNNPHPKIEKEYIIQAAKEMGFKVGYRKRKICETYYEEHPDWSWQKIRKKRVIGEEKVTCFNISSMSVQFRPHLHSEENQINFYHHYNKNLDHIQILHNFVRDSSQGYYGNRFMWLMVDQETGDEFNCYVDEGHLRASDRLYMWGIRDFKESKTEVQWINTTNKNYLNMLDRLVENCPDFMLECEEKTLMRI
jgi:hypothetical protein